jgi:nucleoside permease NupC
MSDPVPDRWHLKKEIQLGHLITTFTVALSAVFYMSKIEQRVAVVESQMVTQRESAALLRSQLERMDAKLDRLIERDRNTK